MTDHSGENSRNPAKKQEKSVLTIGPFNQRTEKQKMFLPPVHQLLAFTDFMFLDYLEKCNDDVGPTLNSKNVTITI